MFPILKLVGPSDVHGSSTASLERAFLYSQEGRECASVISVSNLNKVSNFLFRLYSNKVYHSCLYASGSLIRTLGHNFPPSFFLETRDNSHVWPPTYTPFLLDLWSHELGEVEMCYSWKVSPTTGHFSSELSPWWKLHSLWDLKKTTTTTTF